VYCKASFCYICGYFASADSDHWLNICPRFGRPGDKDAEFDEEYDLDSDEEEEREEDDDDDDDEYFTDWVDLTSETWPGTWFFGAPFFIPDPSSSPLEQLHHDFNIATVVFDALTVRVDYRYDGAQNVPTVVAIALDLVSKLKVNLEIALDDMQDDEPTTDAGRVEQAVNFFNLRIRHDQLRHAFVKAYDRGVSMAGYDRLFSRTRSMRLFKATFERYMILHAPRLISNLAARDDHKDLYERFEYDLGREFDYQRHKGHDRTSEDELLLHTRRMDFEDTYVYA
jgi:hypothetical protein